MRRCLLVVAILAAGLLFAPPSGIAQQSPPGPRVKKPAWHPVKTLSTGQGTVASDAVIASKIGAEILAQGGNAVDAAAAVAFALAVAWPEAGNIGGGGFMMVAPHDEQEVYCVDYRETAPAAATPQMFGLDANRFTHRQVGVPGTVRGLALAHGRWGRLPWRAVVGPAAQLATEGVPVDKHLAKSLNAVLLRPEVRHGAAFAEFRRVYGQPDGKAWQEGQRLLLPDLAATLRTIAERGPEAFYTGPLAKAIAADMAVHEGLITQGDLASYEAKLREPIRIAFRGHEVFAPPPPSAGGITLALMLNQAEALPLGKQRVGTGAERHLMAEIMRRAYHQRALHLGDSDFVDIPAKLTDPDFAKQLAASIDPKRPTGSESLEPAIPVADESPDTTHFSVIDADGMAVSNTYTLEMSWGCRLVVPGTGILLNNEMGDFNPLPGHTDRQGRIGTPPNVIAPGKRMLSSQTPVIVKRQNKVIFITGSPGGRTITNTVFCLLVNVFVHDLHPAMATQLPRHHHQWLPDEIRLESAKFPGLQAPWQWLEHLGHRVVHTDAQGSAHSIFVDHQSDERTAIVDWRRGGGAATQDGRLVSQGNLAAEPMPAPVTELRQADN